MRRFGLLALVAASTTALGQVAFAADMPVKAAPAGCPGCNWNGFYVGVNLGGGIGHDPSQDSISLNPPGGFGNAVAPGVANPISLTSYNSSPAGALGGAQLGFNWQTGHLVLGVEGDWDWARQRDNLQVNNYIASASFVAPAAYNYSNESKIRWLATARARVGWASGYTLAYITGGAAWGGVDSNYAYQATGNLVFASPAAEAGFGTTKSGWVLGSGIETSLAWMGANHWSARLEYLYVDLGTVSNSFTVPVAQTALPPGGSTYTIASSTHIRDNIVRAGLTIASAATALRHPRPPARARPATGAASMSASTRRPESAMSGARSGFALAADDRRCPHQSRNGRVAHRFAAQLHGGWSGRL